MLLSSDRRIVGEEEEEEEDGEDKLYVKPYYGARKKNASILAAERGVGQVLLLVSRKHHNLLLLNGNARLHLACCLGQPDEIATALLQLNPQIWLSKRAYGRRRTPSSTASIEEGRLGIAKELLGVCPLCVKQTWNRHVAVPRHDFETVRRLYVENCTQDSNYCPSTVYISDCSGDTALYLATSRKQFSTMKVQLTQTKIVIATNNNSDFAVLEILNELPQQEEINMEKERYHQRKGASKAKHDTIETKKNLRDGQYILLLVATMMAVLSFETVRNPPAADGGNNFESNLTRDLPQTEKQLPNLFRLFVVCNLINFFSSIAVIANVTREFPLKSLRLLSLSFFTGVYLGTLMAVSPYVTNKTL